MRSTLVRLLFPLILSASLLYLSVGVATEWIASGGRWQLWTGYSIQALFWVSIAHLVNRCLYLFIWDRAFSHEQRAPQLLVDIITILLYLIAAAAIFSLVFEQPLTAVWATSGVFAIVLGFALRDMILDLFTGIAVNIDKPYQIGDWIEIFMNSPEQNFTGEVTEINWRTTRIRTGTNKLVVIPNSLLSTLVVANFRASGERTRFELSYCLDFSVPVKRARRVLLAAVKKTLENKGFYSDPMADVLVDKSTDYGVQYLVRFWISPWYGVPPPSARDIVNTQVLEYIDKAGLTLAYPKYDIYRAEMPQRHLQGDSEEDRIKLVRRVSLLQSLSSDEIGQLSRHLRMMVVDAGTDIIREGGEEASMFVLLEGLLDVRIKREDTDEEISVVQLEPGHFFGEGSLFTGDPRRATITAMTDAVVYEISKSDFSPLLERRPEMAEAISVAMAERDLMNRQKLEQLSEAELNAEQKRVAENYLGRIRSFFSDVLHAP